MEVVLVTSLGWLKVVVLSMCLAHLLLSGVLAKATPTGTPPNMTTPSYMTTPPSMATPSNRITPSNMATPSNRTTPSNMTTPPYMVMSNVTEPFHSLLDGFGAQAGGSWRGQQRGRRAISEGDMHLILDLHNQLRGQVHPPSSNMEYMVWDYELERSAEQWAHACRWEHGPGHMLTQIGQNLGAHWGRDRPPTFHVQAWYDEVRYYTYPYSQECNPQCPFRCSGPVCTHYTQMVWATSNRMGCAINVCYNMNVWGMIWAKAVYLVCNYSPPGNWWGHAPYKYGAPCSACPASYGGGCKANLCYKGQHVECETKLRDQCKGTTCNRYECPPGCLDTPGKVVGSGYYDMQSSVCGAGLHAGVLDNDGGWLDVTRLGRKQRFTKSHKNGVQSIGKNRSANSFKVASVPVKAVTCETTVAAYCPFKKPVRHCPRLYCPRNCLREGRGRVIGTNYYSDKSSICRAAIHAGVIRSDAGGYLDIMPLDKRAQYSGSHQNSITSESLTNPPGGKAFRVFAVI